MQYHGHQKEAGATIVGVSNPGSVTGSPSTVAPTQVKLSRVRGR
eukprot:COSAG02_NODE_58711_length_276_cov_0.988701_1_plen_43_part_01